MFDPSLAHSQIWFNTTLWRHVQSLQDTGIAVQQKLNSLTALKAIIDDLKEKLYYGKRDSAISDDPPVSDSSSNPNTLI